MARGLSEQEVDEMISAIRGVNEDLRRMIAETDEIIRAALAEPRRIPDEEA